MTVKKNIMELAVKRVKAWWIPVVIGVLEIGASVLIFFNPWGGLSLIFAIFFIVDGSADILVGLFTKKFVEGWGWYLISGVFTIIIGVALIINPSLTKLSLALLVSIVIMSGGMIKIGMSISESQDKIRGWGWTLFGGIVQMAVGIYLVLFPGLSSILLSYLTVAAFATIGLFRIISGLRLRSIKKMTTSDLEARLSSIEEKIDAVMGELNTTMAQITSNIEKVTNASEVNIAAEIAKVETLTDFHLNSTTDSMEDLAENAFSNDFLKEVEEDKKDEK